MRDLTLSEIARLRAGDRSDAVPLEMDEERGWIGSLGISGWWSLPQDLSVAWVLGTAAYMTLPLIAVGLWLVLAPVLVFLALDD